MPRFVAFLRAVNVGGHVVKMDQLRRLFESVPLARVETFIASGNVVFSAPARGVPALEKKIERRLAEALGYEVATFVRSTDEVAAIAGYRPFATADLSAPGSSLYVGFLRAEPPKDAARRLVACRTRVDEFHLRGRELYWLCRTRSSESEFSGGRLEKTIGAPVTLRNVTTVKRLAAKYGGSS